MKKPATQSQLIALAKLAPKVDYKEPAKHLVRARQESGNLSDFLLLMDIKPGRNEVPIRAFFEVFTRWDVEGLTYRQFRKALSGFAKFDSKKTKCKLNKKLLTVQTEFKELQSDQNEE